MLERVITQIGQRGVITLPKAIRDTYNLQPGDDVVIIDLGGAFVISPRRLRIDAIADEIRRELSAQGETLESMLKVLRQKREHYGTSETTKRVS